MRRTNERTDDGSVEESEPCIETRQHKLLFDVGPDGTLFDNAGKLGIDLSEIDTVILSHEQDGRAVCVGGSHLYDPATKKAAPEALLDEMAHALGEYRDTRFYTCHSTGKKAFQYLARQMPNLSYFSCGETLEL